MLGESEARTIPIEFQPEPSIANRPHAEAFPVTQDLGPSWMDPYIRYLRDGELPDGRREAAKIRQKAGKYILIEGELYRMSFGVPHLKCLHPDQAELVMAEIHEGECGNHSGGGRIKLYLQGTFGHICR